MSVNIHSVILVLVQVSQEQSHDNGTEWNGDVKHPVNSVGVAPSDRLSCSLNNGSGDAPDNSQSSGIASEVGGNKLDC